MDVPVMKLTLHQAVIAGGWKLVVAVDQIGGAPSKLSEYSAVEDTPEGTAEAAGKIISSLVLKALKK